jgi:thioredoxin-dependent peroxiredoxin
VQGFRDRAPQFREAGVEVLGVSFDPPEQNRAFAEKYDYPWRLLSDEDRTVGEAYQTKRHPEESSPEFAKRRTYLIDPEGIIRKSYEVADIPAHPAEVLADMHELQNA